MLASTGFQLPKPNAAVSFEDPRNAGQVTLLAFDFSGGKEALCDDVCGAAFLATAWDMGSQALKLHPPHAEGRSFANAEAAFQALKFWDKAAQFEDLSAVEAGKLQRQLAGTEDLTFTGLGSAWQAMLTVQRARFASSSQLAAALLGTGDAFLIEHSGPSSARDLVWSGSITGDGPNWLGMQLMLVRDELVQASGGRASWTPYIRNVCHIDINTGHASMAPGQSEWQSTVLEATRALVGVLGASPLAPAASTTSKQQLSRSSRSNVGGRCSSRGGSRAQLPELPRCKRPGCGRAAWSEFCSTACERLQTTLQAEVIGPRCLTNHATKKRHAT